MVLFGLGDFAQVARCYLEDAGEYRVVAFTVDKAHKSKDTFDGLPVIAWEDLPNVYDTHSVSLFVAIGFKNVNRARAEVVGRVKEKGYSLISYVHPSVSRLGKWTLGENCFVFENNVIQPFVEIGDNVILWSGNHIGHHSKIEDHCFLASHVVVSGRVTIGKYCFLGVNATLRDGITLGESCVIGMGASMTKDAAAEGVYTSKGAVRRPTSSLDLMSL